MALLSVKAQHATDEKIAECRYPDFGLGMAVQYVTDHVKHCLRNDLVRG